MTSRGQDIKVFSGETIIMNVTVTDKDGAAVDLTDYDIKYVLAAPTKISKTSELEDGITFIDAEKGQFQIVIDADEIEALYGMHRHGCKVTDKVGVVSELFDGHLIISDSVVNGMEEETPEEP